MIKNCLTIAAIVFFFAVLTTPAWGAEGTVTGRLLTADDSPRQDAVMLFFNTKTGPPPVPESYYRLPDVARAVNSEGIFKVAIPAGSYWYGAITRPSKETKLPTLDRWLYLSRSPEGGGYTQVSVAEGEEVNLGDIRETGPLVATNLTDPVSVLDGIIVDQHDKPLPGFVMEAFGSRDFSRRPLFSSDITLTDGRYSITLVPGKYFLKIRPPSKRARGGRRVDATGKYKLPKPKEVSAPKGTLDIGRTVIETTS